MNYIEDKGSGDRMLIERFKPIVWGLEGHNNSTWYRDVPLVPEYLTLVLMVSALSECLV